MSGLRCFVAMAFDRDDTDALYDDIIEPIVRAIPAVPVRVDRIEHNEDINNRIMEELQRCDFAIADLTYARPSVYFEAGYAQCRVPVVYTSRKDHLRSRLDDEHGNFRVHFDLQMKNIVTWRDATDEQFNKRLKTRLARTIQPLLRTKRLELEATKASQAFNALSLADRRGECINTAVAELKRVGFRHTKPDAEPPIGRTRWIGVKRSGNRLQIAGLYLLSNTGWRDLREHVGWRELDYLLRSVAIHSQVSHAEQHLFLLSLQKVPRTRGSTAFFQFSFNSELDRFEHETKLHIPGSINWRHPESGQRPVRVIVHLIDAIGSEPTLKQALRAHLGKL